MRLLAIAFTAAALAATVLVSSSGAAPAPGHFTKASAEVTNPWYPLTAGTTYVYRGSDEGKRSRDVLKVTHRTKVISGVRCRVIDDRVFLNGRLAEKTTDWYAQDSAGYVWYFGEATATLDSKGKVRSREGSFQDGRDGARRGIFMPAYPRVGQSFVQESYPGHAEDRFRIASRKARIKTPAVSSRHGLLTVETTPLEPGVVDHKIYVRGVGTVFERTVKGGSERLVLDSVRHR
jgi:hypothetical protein